MKNIVLLCNMGLSTSALMKKMKDYADQIGYECDINAYPVSEATEVGKTADCVLLGPQISYQLNKVKQLLPNIPVAAIDMRSYGMLDGKAVFMHARKLID